MEAGFANPRRSELAFEAQLETDQTVSVTYAFCGGFYQPKFEAEVLPEGSTPWTRERYDFRL